MSSVSQSPAAAQDEPKTAAARRAAGLPVEPSAQQETPGAAEPGTDTPAAPGGPEGSAGASADPPANVLPEQPAKAVERHAGEVSIETLTSEEVELLRQLRTTRGQEILEKLAAAPIGVGTEADPYTLYHLRGCPDPERTEVFDSERPSGQKVTIKRCIECGVQNIIDH